MLKQLIHTGSMATIFLMVFAFAETLRRKYSVKVEVTRKFVHCSTGLLTLTFPFLFKSHWSVFLLSTGFLLVLFVSKKHQWLDSIHGVKRKTKGAQLFPFVVYLSFVMMLQMEQMMFYFLPILILSICDPLAALVGKKYNIGVYRVWNQKKTLIGSLAFFLSALLVSMLSMNIFCLGGYYISMQSIVVLTLGATVAEAITINGFDNLTIPASVVAILFQILEANPVIC